MLRLELRFYIDHPSHRANNVIFYSLHVFAGAILIKAHPQIYVDTLHAHSASCTVLCAGSRFLCNLRLEEVLLRVAQHALCQPDTEKLITE